MIFDNFKVGGNVARYSITGSAKKKANIHNSEELIQKIWESVRSNNGIMVCMSNHVLNYLGMIYIIRIIYYFFITGITAINDGENTYH